jgi:hypothetical protein
MPWRRAYSTPFDRDAIAAIWTSFRRRAGRITGVHRDARRAQDAKSGHAISLL